MLTENFLLTLLEEIFSVLSFLSDEILLCGISSAPLSRTEKPVRIRPLLSDASYAAILVPRRICTDDRIDRKPTAIMITAKNAGTFFLDTTANRMSPAPSSIPMIQAIVMTGDISFYPFTRIFRMNHILMP